MPRTRITAGCHPHNARLFTAEAESQLRKLLADRRVNAVGEIGLDYHYDLSPRSQQREVFRRQLRIAHEAGLPVALHIREAHDEALAILREEGFPEAGTVLHCCSLGPGQIEPWIEAGCYIAYGGVVTFAKSDEAREGAKLVPADRLLLETDAPYMAPVPLRGSVCEPSQVMLSAECLAAVRGCNTADEQAGLLKAVRANAEQLLNRPPTPWQKAQAEAAKAQVQ